MSGVVLERDRELAALLRAARSAGRGSGREPGDGYGDSGARPRGQVALVRGEAGIGKSTLVAALRGALPPDARLLVGHCDDLATARVLGPLRDLAPSAGGELAHALREGFDRDRLYPALLAELTWPGHATVLVVEDVHWADDATLDVLRLLVRRVAQHPVLLVLTFRDDLPRDHPLHRLLALAHAGPVTDLPLEPLSPDAVGRLGGDGRLHALSSGNPFFVHELLTASRGSVPASVTESVLARLEHLSPATRVPS